MKLVKLKIENIATYEKQEIDFSSLRFPVFVTGKTGSGKTTLFVDAITAALYGKAYNVAKQGFYKELIMKGKEYGRIVLRFYMSGCEYEISRTFYRDSSKSPTVFLKVIENGEERVETYRKQTVEQRILKMIGADYNTLLNSAIVRQGDVYQFVEMTGAKRRELLINIFRISLDNLKEVARNRLNKVSGEHQRISGRIEEIEKIVADEKKYREDLEHLRNEKPTIIAKLNDLKNQKRILEEKLEQVNNRYGELRQKLETILEFERQLLDKKRKREEIMKSVIEIEKKMEKYSIEKIALADRFEKSLNDYKVKKEGLSRMKNELERLQQLLEKKKKLEQKLLDYKKLEHVDEQLAELRDRKGDIERQIGALQSSIESINDALNKLKTSGARCPVCGSELSEMKKHEREIHLKREMEQHKKMLMEKKYELAEINNRLKELEALSKKKQKLDGEICRLREDLRGVHIDEELVREKETKISEVESAINAILEDIARYTNTREIGEAEARIREMRKLKERIPELKEKKRIINELDGEIESLSKKVSAKVEIEKNIAQIELERTKLRNQLSEINKEISNLEQRLGKIDERISLLEQKLSEIEALKKDLKELKKKKQELELDERAYEFLIKHIFSQGALPAKLLEEYLQYIENDANDYLAKFGQDIRIRLIIRKIRDTQTVDIKAYANGYERPIETFSGGERTLIGFAVRLAIGRLLARISSIKEKPRFLIIDEGFGPLDEECRHAVAEALSRLYESSEYEQIIVISHQQDLKYHPIFKTIIEVVKTDNGISRVFIR